MPRLYSRSRLNGRAAYSKGQTQHTHAAKALVSRQMAHVQAAVDAAGEVVRAGVYDAETCRGVLHSAAGGGQIAALELLLAAGAPVDAKDGNGLTALQVAPAQLGAMPQPSMYNFQLRASLAPLYASVMSFACPPRWSCCGGGRAHGCAER